MLGEKSIGFRLAHELEGILTGIQADGLIHPLEKDRVARWLQANQPFAHLRPFDELHRRLAFALADGVLSMDECDDLLFVTQKLTTVNPYFDALRSGLQVLLGILTGIVADRRIRPTEVSALSDWSEEWTHLKGLWPFDEAVAIVTAIITEKATAEAGYNHLFALAQQFPLAGEQTDMFAPLTIQGVCAVDPTMVFQGKRFTFTGASQKCERKVMETHVEAKGGTHHPSVTKSVDYLVVCDEGNPCWAFACYGRKVEQAYLLRRSGHPIVIAHEADFWDALA